MMQAPRIVRWTLPALLLTWVVGGYLIVTASRHGDGAKPGSSVGTTTTTRPRHHRPRRVRVSRGDTASRIAHRANLTVGELLELNPDVDPRALRPGRRLKIAP
jgi:LysM repeat protein